MFAANFSSPSATSSSARTRRTRESLAPSPAGRALRMAGLAALLSLVGPGALSAQALGTMQVSARVVPAAVAWSLQVAVSWPIEPPSPIATGAPGALSATSNERPNVDVLATSARCSFWILPLSGPLRLVAMSVPAAFDFDAVDFTASIESSGPIV